MGEGRACFNEQTAQVTNISNNDDSDELAVELLRLKNELKAQAVTDQRAPRVIFDDFCVNGDIFLSPSRVVTNHCSEEVEEWTAAIYVSQRLRTALVNTSTFVLHIDGRFKLLPEQLHAYQLVTIHEAAESSYLQSISMAAICRMHRQLRLQHLVDTNVEAAKTLQMLMSLALLPAERIALDLRVIAHYSVLHGLAARFRILLR
ncbi:hypothetical protein J6590_070942 [Homalodisca vitripennis]|nr:hypothetical protein J6590_070942 [Homalodisca vitripennis]